MTTEQERITQKDNVYKLRAVDGYHSEVDILCKLTDTGNGYIFKLPSYSSTSQVNYICMDYAEADYIFKLLKHLDLNTESVVVGT